MIRPSSKASAVRLLFPSRSPYADLEGLVLPSDDEDGFLDFTDELFLRYELPAAIRAEVARCL